MSTAETARGDTLATLAEINVESRPRTLTQEEWGKRRRGLTISPQNVSGVAREVLSTLIQPTGPAPYNGPINPWLRDKSPSIVGTMWAGVPVIKNSRREEDGSWTIDCSRQSNEESARYLRLLPAEENAEVQYGMCSFRMDKFSSFAQKRFGPRSEWEVKAVRVATHRGAHFRVDKIVASALTLASSENQSDDGKEFKALLGSSSLCKFVESLTSQCYVDTPSEQDILLNKDPSYKRMVRLIIHHAYPSLFFPTRETGLEAFNLALGERNTDDWQEAIVWPVVYNVFMPQEIFDRASYNLEKGIPPLIPMYATMNSWMFNGEWNYACTGLDITGSLNMGSRGKKILAGVLNCFNLDMPGYASFWDTDYDCPDRGWVDTFLEVAEELREFNMGWNYAHKIDMALFIARKIPVLLDTNKPGIGPQTRYARLRDLEKDLEGHITQISTYECDSTGKALEDQSTSQETPPTDSPPENSNDSDGVEEGERVCSGCDHTVDEALECVTCGCALCLECSYVCVSCESTLCSECEEECPACGDHFCYNCEESHGCLTCQRCEDRTTLSNGQECSNCNLFYCYDCIDGSCERCHAEDLCRSCMEDHDCCPGSNR